MMLFLFFCKCTYNSSNHQRFFQSFNFIIHIFVEIFIVILPQNAFYFAAKRFLFCRKTPSILPQNAFHFAAKRFLFCRKTPSILPQNGFHNHNKSNKIRISALLDYIHNYYFL